MYNVIIVGDYPAQSDLDAGTCMASDKEKILWAIISRVLKADVDDFAPCYLMNERPVEGGKYSDKKIKEAGIALKNKLIKLKPKAVVCLGETVMNALCGVKGITSHRGEVFSWDDEQGGLIKVVPTFSPAYVQNASVQLEKFAGDLQLARNISLGIEEKQGQSLNHVCLTVSDAKKAIDYCVEVGICCFDFETTKLTNLETFDPNFKATLLSVSFQHGSSYSIPLEHYQTPFTPDEVAEILAYFFDRVLENPEVHKVAHNTKFDMHVAARYGCKKFRGRYDDTMLMHHLLDETKKHGLKEVTKEYYPDFGGYEKEVRRFEWAKVPLQILAPYGGLDTDLTLRLRTVFTDMLMQDLRVYKIYRNLTIPALHALFEAEETGMLIDREQMAINIKRAEELYEMMEAKLRDYRQVKMFESIMRDQIVSEKIAELEEKRDAAKGKTRVNYDEKINSIKAGTTDLYVGMNFDSVPQMGKLLYSDAGFGFPMPYVKKKRKEAEATGKEYLMELNDDTGFIDDLLLYRSIGKTLSTYLHGINDRLDTLDRVHTSFLLHGTKSGRLSSQNPNLQNLTNVAKLTDRIAIEVVTMVKKPFIMPKGYTLAQIDFSQAELRIIASFAGETAMLEAYDAGIDLHALYASKMLNTTLDEFYLLPKDQQKNWRTRAKAGNFGLIYGMSAEGLVDYAKNNYGVVLTLKEATTMRNAFFSMYPRLLEYHDTYVAKGRKFGYVRTLYGRKRHLPDIDNSQEFVRAMDERVAINSPIQGTSGEFTVFAVSLLRNRLDPRVKFVNTVHDSIIYYIPDDILDSQLRVIKYTCENLPNKQYFDRELEGVSMKVDIETSKIGWKDLQPYELAA